MNNSLPKITFIVVKKRHNTRFFLQDPKTENMNNVPPGILDSPIMNSSSCFLLLGTVVDTDIVHPQHFDFYLNSHAAIQGTDKHSSYLLFKYRSFSV